MAAGGWGIRILRPHGAGGGGAGLQQLGGTLSRCDDDPVPGPLPPRSVPALEFNRLPHFPLCWPRTQVGELDAAEEALNTYVLQAKRSSLVGEALVAVEAKDQFVCRAAFARAVLESERAARLMLKGPALVASVMAAVKQVLDGIALAQQSDRHAFLVYNGSVHYWRVARPLQREGLRAQLVPSLETVLKALEKVAGQEEWRCRNLLSLAMCQFEAGNSPAAVASAVAAADLAKVRP